MSGRFELVVAEIDMSPPPLPPGDHTLITLEQASWLPELGDQFDPRAIWRAADTFRLRTTRPTGRRLYTTRAWVADWISECPDPSLRHALTMTTTETRGSSGTRRSPASVVASVSLAARLTKLRGP